MEDKEQSWKFDSWKFDSRKADLCRFQKCVKCSDVACHDWLKLYLKYSILEDICICYDLYVLYVIFKDGRYISLVH